MEIVNLQILSHPMNWLTVFLMVAIAAIAVHLLLQFVPATPDK